MDKKKSKLIINSKKEINDKAVVPGIKATLGYGPLFPNATVKKWCDFNISFSYENQSQINSLKNKLPDMFLDREWFTVCADRMNWDALNNYGVEDNDGEEHSIDEVMTHDTEYSNISSWVQTYAKDKNGVIKEFDKVVPDGSQFCGMHIQEDALYYFLKRFIEVDQMTVKIDNLTISGGEYDRDMEKYIESAKFEKLKDDYNKRNQRKVLKSQLHSLKYDEQSQNKVQDNGMEM